MTCICKPSFIICVQSLNNTGQCMSEKWLRTCSKPGFLLQLIWPPVRHIGSDFGGKNWCAYVSHHSSSVCQVWTTLVNACPRNGWGHVQHQVIFITKLAASRPSWIWCQKQMTCICIPSCVVFVHACVHPQPYLGHVWTDFICTWHTRT